MTPDPLASAPTDAPDPALLELLEAELERVLASRAVSAVPAPPGREASRVTDLRVVPADGAFELRWSYRCAGDYDGNGEVNAADLVPLAARFGARYGEPSWPVAQRADGDANGELSYADVTPIGANLLAAVDGYAVYGRSSGGQFAELGRFEFPSGSQFAFVWPLATVEHDWYAVAPLLDGQTGALSYAAFRQPERIEFAGRRWITRRVDGLQGPGPNYWSDLPGHVTVEAPSQAVTPAPLETLRLAASFNRADGYASAEVYSEEPTGYGTYVFHVETPPEQLHPQIVLGLFTYDYTDAGFAQNANSEIDIELSHWGVRRDDYLSFAVQPSHGVLDGADATFAERVRSLPLPELAGGATTHVFRWTPLAVHFASYPGNAAPTAAQLATWSFGPQARTWAYTTLNPPRVKTEEGVTSAPVVIPTPGEAGVHINLWWFQRGPEPLPIPPQQVVRISGFSFTPL